MTNDERMANEIMEVLRRVRMRAASEGKGDSPEIGEAEAEVESSCLS